MVLSLRNVFFSQLFVEQKRWNFYLCVQSRLNLFSGWTMHLKFGRLFRWDVHHSVPCLFWTGRCFLDIRWNLRFRYNYSWLYIEDIFNKCWLFLSPLHSPRRCRQFSRRRRIYAGQQALVLLEVLLVFSNTVDAPLDSYLLPLWTEAHHVQWRVLSNFRLRYSKFYSLQGGPKSYQNNNR